MTIIRNHYQMNHHRASSKAQTGVVLLMFLLILVTGASYSLLNQLNAATNLHTRQQATSRALSEAKQVLIGYALTYPENNVGFGPGYLPCPDRNNDGFINAGTCASSTSTTIGRFPWRSLGVREMVDSSGARLWYVLSDNYRNNPKINNSGGYMNSDNAGQLTLDGTGDIVALIIAPGEPVVNVNTGLSQNRDPLETDIAVEIAQYLEAENADIGGDYDVDFATTDPVTDPSNYNRMSEYFNDMVITITRQELMGLVEKRVLAEVENSINNYQNSVAAAFPWLSPFADPSASAFRGQATTYQGHIPFHWSNDPDSILVGTGANIVDRNPFSTSLSVSWNIVNADLSAGLYISDDTMQDSSFNDLVYGVIDPVDITNASCEWSNRNSVKCTGTTIISDPTCSTYSGTCSQTSMSCDRTYTFDLEFLDEPAATISMTDPDAANVRTRDVTVDISLLTTTLTNYSIQIDDSYTLRGPNPPCNPVTNSDTRTLTVDVGTSTGTITIAGIHYDLDTDGMDLNADNDYDDAGEFSPEIPEWFVANDWQDLVYVAYASGEPLPGDTTAGQDCVSLATSCITVNINGIATNNIRSVAIIAGEDLSGNRPSTNMEDYFELENKDFCETGCVSSPFDDVLEKTKLSTTYNDQTRIVSTAP